MRDTRPIIRIASQGRNKRGAVVRVASKVPRTLPTVPVPSDNHFLQDEDGFAISDTTGSNIYDNITP